MISPNKWELRFLYLAELVASWSKDPSTRVGCILAKGNKVISLGFNGYPSGIKDLNEERETKYAKTIHAEINAILYAKQDLNGCTLYVTPLQPCSNCASIIIQAGITKVIVGCKTDTDESRWIESFDQSTKMFKEAGIPVYGVLL